jgi:hypothetical protein
LFFFVFPCASQWTARRRKQCATPQTNRSELRHWETFPTHFERRFTLRALKCFSILFLLPFQPYRGDYCPPFYFLSYFPSCSVPLDFLPSVCATCSPVGVHSSVARLSSLDGPRPLTPPRLRLRFFFMLFFCCTGAVLLVRSRVELSSPFQCGTVLVSISHVDNPFPTPSL